MLRLSLLILIALIAWAPLFEALARTEP